MISSPGGTPAKLVDGWDWPATQIYFRASYFCNTASFVRIRKRSGAIGCDCCEALCGFVDGNVVAREDGFMTRSG